MLDNDRINELIQENIDNGYYIKEELKHEVHDLFHSLMKEKNNRTKDENLQKKLITNIVAKLSFDENPSAIFTQHGDNKHMVYFDNRLYKGAGKDIIDVLSSYDIPTDVLKVLSWDAPFDENIKEVPGLRITQAIDKSSGSPTVDYIEIKYNNKVIYRSENENSLKYLNIDEEYDDEIPEEYYLTKTGDYRINPLNNIYKIGTETITEEIDRLGNTIFRNSKGRFARKV